MGELYAGRGSSGRDERETADVALLIDWENLKISLARNFGGVTPNIGSLVQAAREVGRLVTATAYADWTQENLRFDAQNLYRAGIEPVYVPRYTIRQEAPAGAPGAVGRAPFSSAAFKNSADVRLAVDAVDICGRLGNVGVFMLVTGDGDLIHALNFLRLNGRRVVVVGVGGSISQLFAGAADEVLQYERDIDPLGAGLARPVAPVPSTSRAAHVPMETVFEWITDVLRARSGGIAYPFTRLGHDLKQLYGFSALEWYGIPFKDLMRRAEAAGHVHLSTGGGMDYASVADLAAPSLEGADIAEAAAEAEAVADGEHAETRPAMALATDRLEFDVLSEDEQAALIAHLKRLQDNSPFMVFKYIVDNLTYFSVLPRLSREQVELVVNSLRARGILHATEQWAQSPDGMPYRRTCLHLNEQHEAVRTVLEGRTAVEAHPEARRAFELLPDALAAAKEASGLGYFPAVQHALEEALGHTLRDLGFPRPMAFFAAAERAGQVRLARLQNGADIVLDPEEPEPQVPPTSRTGTVLEKLSPDSTAEAVRILAAAEDAAGGVPRTGSLVVLLRHGLAAVGACELSSSEVNRLLKVELVERGYVERIHVCVPHQETGVPQLVEAFRLRRDHPDVAAALEAATSTLPPEIEVRTYATISGCPEPLVS